MNERTVMAVEFGKVSPESAVTDSLVSVRGFGVPMSMPVTVVNV